MVEIQNPWLAAGGVLSLIAALLHLGCVLGGAPWYRFFGAGERLARMAEYGVATPAIYAIVITAILTIWAAYAFSGAGLIPRLPLLRTGLVAITAIYLIRAAALPLMLVKMSDRGTTFLIVSSAIVGVYGMVHAVGLVTEWHSLGGP